MILMKRKCIIEYFEKGLTRREIGKRCDCSHSTVVKFLQKNYPKDKYREINNKKKYSRNMKYTLWNSKICRYKRYRFHKRPLCFWYGNKYVPIGYFDDFVTVEIINELVEESL